MTNIIAWFKGHATAILATVIAVSKAGVLGKGAASLITALAAALGS